MTDVTARTVEYRDLDAIVEADRNPKKHNIEGVISSLASLGVVDAIGIEDGRTGKLVAGHGRTTALRTMRNRELDPPDGVLEVDGRWLVPVLVGWSSVDDTQAEQAIIGLNQHTIAGGWDNVILAQMMSDLQAAGSPLDAIGFEEWTVEVDDDAAAEIAAEAEGLDATPEPSRGELATLIDVSLGEPKHKVEHGQRWRVGPHWLFVVDLLTEAHVFAGYLERGWLFAPYAGPFLTATIRAVERPTVMVQPDRYLAGHLLDQHRAIFPQDTVEVVPW